MRYMFGLVGLLVTVAIVITVFTNNAANTVKQSKPAVDTAQQLSGHDASGKAAKDSIKLEGVDDAGGRFKGLSVVKIDPAGAFATYYGLKLNDEIIQAGSYNFKGDDAEMAQAMTQDAYSKFLPLIIVRDGKQMTLPVKP